MYWAIYALYLILFFVAYFCLYSWSLFFHIHFKHPFSVIEDWFYINNLQLLALAKLFAFFLGKKMVSTYIPSLLPNYVQGVTALFKNSIPLLIASICFFLGLYFFHIEGFSEGRIYPLKDLFVIAFFLIPYLTLDFVFLEIWGFTNNFSISKKLFLHLLVSIIFFTNHILLNPYSLGNAFLIIHLVIIIIFQLIFQFRRGGILVCAVFFNLMLSIGLGTDFFYGNTMSLFKLKNPLTIFTLMSFTVYWILYASYFRKQLTHSF